MHNSAREFLSNICDLQSIGKAALPAFCHGHLGELFVEYKESEVLKIENGIVQAPNLNFKQGFGLRTFVEESTRYSFSSCLDAKDVEQALHTIGKGEREFVVSPKDEAQKLYSSQRFINSVDLKAKMNFLQDIDSYARSKTSNIRQVSATLSSSWQVVYILDDEGKESFDIRPLVTLSVLVVVEKDGKVESGICAGGGRFGYDSVVNPATKIEYVDEAVRQALVKLSAVQAPVGEMPVLLGNSWAGILLHEAVGHGLEGDAIRKGTSSFCDLYKEQIAAPNVTVIDDGTIQNRRGSINIDDEGNKTQRNVLIENGILVGLMQDRQNAMLMETHVTGNGRRTGYEYVPIPRMTNTFMTNGDYCFDEMLASVKNGVYAKTFSDGQVDTTSGKFVFSASEAYLIENGKITTPIKGAMLIGDGPSILKKVSMIGNDFSLDRGIGTCGKAGQWVPVGVGEPSVLIDKITVGGTDL